MTTTMSPQQRRQTSCGNTVGQCGTSAASSEVMPPWRQGQKSPAQDLEEETVGPSVQERRRQRQGKAQVARLQSQLRLERRRKRLLSQRLREQWHEARGIISGLKRQCQVALEQADQLAATVSEQRETLRMQERLLRLTVRGEEA